MRFFKKLVIRIKCFKYGIINYTINKDFSIDVNENVNLSNRGLKKLPLKFNKVNGYFDCSRNNLTSLEGSPIEVNGCFDCKYNYLTSFKGSPKFVIGKFYCISNNIKSFEYFPNYCDELYCIDNPIWCIYVIFNNTFKIELLNDFDIFRDEDTDCPSIFIDRLYDFCCEINFGIDIIHYKKNISDHYKIKNENNLIL